MTTDETVLARAQRLGIPVKEAARVRQWAPASVRRDLYIKLFRQDLDSFGEVWKAVPKETHGFLMRARQIAFREWEDEQRAANVLDLLLEGELQWDTPRPKRGGHRPKMTKAEKQAKEKARKKALWEARVKAVELKKLL